jgi:hypothetical protein
LKGEHHDAKEANDESRLAVKQWQIFEPLIFASQNEQRVNTFNVSNPFYLRLAEEKEEEKAGTVTR